MTDQPDAGLPSKTDPSVTPWAAATPAEPSGPAMTVPPTGPDQPLTAPPSPGADWQSSAPPASWSSQAGVAYAPVQVQPLVASRAPRRGLRWLVAAVVVVLVAVSASAVFYIVAGSGSSSTVARWAPADSIMYMEGRFDLPGDQHEKTGQFLSAFPGFADPSTLDAKLAEVFDKAVSSASDGKADYSTDIKPWFGGQAAFALTSLPTMSMVSSTDTGARGAFLLSVTDAAKAGTWLSGVVKSSSTTTTNATYNGVDLTVFDSGGSSFAVGVDGTVLLGGDLATVHEMIDGKGNDGLASTADFKQAVAAAPKDRIGFVFMEMQKYLTAEISAMPTATDMYPKEILDQLPAWIGMSARFESDALVMDDYMPAPAGAVASTDHASTLSAHLPASTVASYEVHDVGTLVKSAVASYQKIPAYKDGLTTVLDALDKVGGLDSFVSWIGDADVAVTLDGTTVGGGLVVALPDATASTDATAKFAALKNLIAVTGLSTAKVTTETHGGATITTIDLGSIKDLESLSGTSGTSVGIPDEISAGRVALSYTVTDTLAIVGIGGDGFVKAVLDTKAGSSLADQPRYQTAIGGAGGSNSSQGYVDLAAIVKAAEAQIPADSAADFNTNVKPYLAPFAAFAFTTQGGDIEHGRFILTVTK